MTVRNTPAAYGWLAGLLVFLFALIAIANGGCDHQPRPTRVVRGFLRTPTERAWATVRVLASCGQEGSGVLVDSGRVITAFHVINCVPFPEIRMANALRVQTLDGALWTAYYDVTDPSRDLVRLRLKVPVPNVTQARIVHAELRDTACLWTAAPERAERCGSVTELGTDDRQVGDVLVDHPDIWFGNSGSAVYNASGAIVGIATRLRFCMQLDVELFRFFGIRPDKTCGGRVSSIDDSPVLP